MRPSWRRATTEVVVIVTGVLVALVIQAAWDDYQEGRAARLYLEALRGEVQEHLDQLGNGHAILDGSFEGLDLATRAIVDGEVGDVVEFTESLMVSSANSFIPRMSRAVYDDLLSSGRLTHLPTSVRRSIADYYTFSVFVERTESNNAAVGATLRHVVARHIPGELVRGDGTRTLVLPEGKEGEGLARLELAVRRLLEDPDLPVQVNLTRHVLNERRHLIGLLEARAGRMIEGLEEAQ